MGYCFKMADIHVTADGSQSSWGFYDMAIERGSGWLTVEGRRQETQKAKDLQLQQVSKIYEKIR